MMAEHFVAVVAPISRVLGAVILNIGHKDGSFDCAERRAVSGEAMNNALVHRSSAATIRINFETLDWQL